MTDDQWISFKVESETYVHSVDKIKEIIPYTPPVPIPGSPSAMEGILNIRGNVVVILSGHSLLNRKQPATQDESRRIIILELETEQAGISVDSVDNIITFQPDEAQWTDQGSRQRITRGTLHLDGKLYILTDFSTCIGVVNEEE